MQERLFKNPKIEVVWNSVLEEVLGTREPQVRNRGQAEERDHGRDLRPQG